MTTVECRTRPGQVFLGLGDDQLLAQLLHVGGVVQLIKRVALATFLFEGIGACLLSIRFIPELGIATGIYYSVFHSISAFCNAGFDLMGRFAEFSSLTPVIITFLL